MHSWRNGRRRRFKPFYKRIVGSNPTECTYEYAPMVELVDTPDLGSGAGRRMSSSLIRGTEQQKEDHPFLNLHKSMAKGC